MEPRWALSGIGIGGGNTSVTQPAVVMIAATTADPKSVTIEYQVNVSPEVAAPIELGVYRSSDDRFDGNDRLVDRVTLVAPGGVGTAGQALSLDQAGRPATAVGTHSLTIPLAQGLPPYPRKPYVLVVANPGGATATVAAEQTAAFRTYTIGIITHGGIIEKSWKHGPPWEIQVAHAMKHQGYDAVIAYNWVAQSHKPGAAIQQSSRLARMIHGTARRFPSSGPINLHFIGHSEGNVVNTYAIVRLQRRMTPALQAGYLEETLLDPHAANNHVPGQQYSPALGPVGGLADAVVQVYQGEAKDPPVVIPRAVASAQVIYEHSPTRGSWGTVNLWGQVPVRVENPGTVVHYYDLSAAGATHSGKTGVALWYRNFVAPTLGNQAPLLHELQLDGQIDQATEPASATASGATAVAPVRGMDRAEAARRALAIRDAEVYGPALVVPTDRPEFSGTAAPGSAVRIQVGPATRPSDLALAGWTTAGEDGRWSITTRRSLPAGQYRALATAFSRALHTRPGLTIVPTQPLGRFVVEAATGRVSPRP